jgi:ribosomal protein L23
MCKLEKEVEDLECLVVNTMRHALREEIKEAVEERFEIGTRIIFLLLNMMVGSFD